MASRAKKPPGDEGTATPSTTRPARLRVMRPEVEEVLRSPRRGRHKLKAGGGGGDRRVAAEDDEDGPPRYDCAFQSEDSGEDGFAPPDMVWCKVKSHPWWPAQVFDAADASEQALRHAKSGAPGGVAHHLVAYFWDNTFAWSDPAALLPFRANFRSLAGKSTAFKCASAVDAALDEVERRVEAGLSCACFPNTRKRQEVQNSGIRKGAYGAVVDEVYMRDTFRGELFLEYISALARNPLSGADRLDLATAKAQLRSFNRLRGPRELPEFVTYQGIEDVPTETTPNTKRKNMEKPIEDDVLSKEKKPRLGESSLRKRDAAKEEVAVDEEISVPSKSSARKKTSKDVEKTESPAIKKDVVVEDSSKQSKSKISKSLAERKKKKKDSSRDTDKGESLAEPAEEDAVNEDSSMPGEEATDGTLSKEKKSKISKSPAKKKKQDTSKDADKNESLPEPVEKDTTNEDISMPSGGVTDGTLSKGGKSKISKSSAKTKKKDTSKVADKTESLPEPAKEEATGDNSSTPGATDGTLIKEMKSKIGKSPAKKKQDTSKDADGLETGGGSKTPAKKAVDIPVSESKSARRLRPVHKTEDASEGSKGPRNDDVGEKTTKGKHNDAALLKEKNNGGRRASSARKKDKIVEDGDGPAADSSVMKDPVSPGNKKSRLGEASVAKDAPFSISEHGRKRKKLSELMVEAGTPKPSPAGKSKARGKPSLPASTDKPDHDAEDTPKTRGKRSLPALTEKPENPDRETKNKMKTRGKHSLPESTEEPEDPDRDMKDTMKTTKRKKLDTLGDVSAQPQPVSSKRSTKGLAATPKAAGKKPQPSPAVKANGGDTLGHSSSQPQPLSPKRSTKAREVAGKAAELKPHASPAVNADGEASQTRSRRTKNSEETTVPDKSPRSAKPGKGKKGASAEDSLSCGEMHSQLCVAASDLEKVGGITPASVMFFTEFGKSSCPSSSDVEKEIPIEAANADSSIHVDEAIREKAANEVASPHAEENIPEEAAKKVASPHAEEEILERATLATDKVASPHAEEEMPEKAAGNVASPHADEEVPEKPTDNKPSPSELPMADHKKEVIEKPTDNEPSPSEPPVKEVPEKPTEKEPSPSELPVADHMKEVPEKPTDKDPSPHAEQEIPENSTDKVVSPHAQEEVPEKPTEKEPPVADHMKEVPEKPTEKEPSPSELPLADHTQEVPEKPTEKGPSPLEPPVADHMKEVPEKPRDNEPSPSELLVTDHTKEVPEKPTDKESSPSELLVTDHTKEVPEKATEKEPSPSELPVADDMKEVPEKATEKEPSPSEPPVADDMKQVPEKATDSEPSPPEPSVADHMKEVPEKPADKEPSPSELVVADHMKDDYWGDILITVEEPISSLKKKEDKSQSKTSKTNAEHQAEAATPNKEPPVSARNVEVEEPKAAAKERPSASVVNVEEPTTAAESKQGDNTENGKGEAKPQPSVASNGAQQLANQNADEMAAESPKSLTGLVLHFSRPDAVPSHTDLVKLFSQYGPVSEARTQTGNTTNSATVIFKCHYDAEGAFHGAGTMTRILGPHLAHFRLSDFPNSSGGGAGASSGNGAGQGAS